MKLSVFRRRLKSKVSNSKNRSRKKLSLLSVSIGLFISALLIFCVVQLAIVSVLSPQGKELQSLNNEKNLIIEENRQLEQDIATISSLPVIEGRAEKELSMRRASDIFYVDRPEGEQIGELLNPDENIDTIAQGE